ncbi:MAG TPA: preprotein translocase subunit YajC [Streptosporangiaceae bacterium]|nr:preprotein translocase subunit YajC [Streptosporangiaceae bacterium]
MGPIATTAPIAPAAAPLAAAKSSSGSPFTLIIILLLIVGVFYFLMIRPQRNRQRQAMQTQSGVVPGQRVRTTAGLYGTVTAVEDGDVVIEVSPGVEVRFLKRAIMDVLSDAPDDGSGTTYGPDGAAGLDGTAGGDGIAGRDGTIDSTGNGAYPAADDAEPQPPATRPAADAGTDGGRDGQAAEK